jgi:hypothetical protein
MEDGPVTPQVMPADEWAGVRSGDAATRVAVGPIARTVAQSDGECTACGFSIAVGDPIALTAETDEGGAWIHARCWR